MLKKILIALVAAIVLLLVVASFQPEDFRITRSITVNAPASKIYPLVNDFHQWANWSPWDKMDPSMKKTYAGPATGEGATYSWVGNGKVGEGSMTIFKAKPYEYILLKLNFLKPMKAENLSAFTFRPEAPGTNVTWTMSGKVNLIGKVIHLFMN
ncbi:MAG: SRPBCC family protein, partial [Bdellovibrionota bacterium]